MRRAPSTPPELPGYTFVKLLGSGGFSDVFLYEQHLPKRRVAVKVLLTEELTAANRAAFVAEANLMAQLSAHPYIVSIFHADVASDDRPYFVMEYCSGPSLAERYKREPLSVVDVLRTGIRVSGAVATAHGAGILHRDIKPANILTNDFGWPALTDFGISSALDDGLPLSTATLDSLTGDTSGTTGSASVGMSVPWSPAEMFEDDPEPDVRADVFSLAATLYTLLAGHTPFEIRGRSNGALDLIGRIERGAVTPLARDDVPRSLVAVLMKGMATRREDRFASTIEFARALQRVELELGYTPTTIDVPNLHLEEAVREGGDDDADATRARGVATIEAQPVVPIEPPLVDDDATVARGATTVHAQAPTAQVPAAPAPVAEDAPLETVVRRPQQAPPPADPPAAHAPATASEAPPQPKASRANRIALWAGAAALVLVAAAVTAGIVLGGPPAPVEPKTSPSPGGGSAIVVDRVPTPELVSAQASDGAVVFTVENPDEQDGDRMIWRRTDRGDDEPVRQVQEGTFTVDRASDAPVCVEVSIVRAGKGSANPLAGCYPS
ncbi:serine/threonine protein kinase [Salinibacterium sp. dk2585]|uniref:serine/threonine-protein kinase n=1 Tax=unclassified Salinibacterium TaxID=2632331 RepID=UPI0011C24551|nr:MULTISPECIES: serine/threonine-protein kinase [unclassified Salinibacterium]QEE60938.1 serine/threonine protein kinase [Salinibacterium sp. dk2585]TXK56009.1 serine/threonine protein kinase [Salinibacterium sp. dk5596]